MSASAAPSAAPVAYNLDGPGGARGTGVLLIHGLTASSTEMRPLADHLHAREPAWPILAVTLGGHGGSLEDLERVTRLERPEDVWLRDGEAALERLGRASSTVVLAGLSMGAALCLRLVAGRSDRVAALVLLAPVLGLKTWERAGLAVVGLFRSRIEKPAWKREYYRERGLNAQPAYPVAGLKALDRNGREAWAAAPLVGKLGIPTLIVAGRRDERTSRRTIERLRARIGPEVCEVRWLERSGHILTVEPDREELFAACAEFLRGRVRAPAPGEQGR